MGERRAVYSEKPCETLHYTKLDGAWGHFPYCVHRKSGRACNGCIGDGFRVDLESRVEVERKPIMGVFRYFWAYVAIEDRSASVAVPGPANEEAP